MYGGKKYGITTAKRETIRGIRFKTRRAQCCFGYSWEDIAQTVCEELENDTEKQKWISHQAQKRRFPSTGTLISNFPEVRFHRARIFNSFLYRIEVDETSLRECAAKLQGMGNTAKR